MKTLDQQSSTSAFGSMKCRGTHLLSKHKILIFFPGTTASCQAEDLMVLAAAEKTTSGITLPSSNSPEVTQKSINELKRLSGLPWDQLARLFNVSRRSLHFWASGQPLSRFNEEQLNRLLATIRYIDRGSASLTRSLLLTLDDSGNSLFDLLVAGKHEEFKQLAGAGNPPQRPQLGSLSKDAYEERMPPNPENLVNALQDTIHREVGQSRPATVERSQKNSSGK